MYTNDVYVDHVCTYGYGSKMGSPKIDKKWMMHTNKTCGPPGL